MKEIDEDFFENWSEETAYLVGYICADGCIHKRSGRKRSLILTITSKDLQHLEKINKTLGSNYKISTKKNSSGGFAYHIAITNYVFCSRAVARGILPRKTMTLGPIEIPDRYFKDFFRGFFDADGSVYIYNVNGTYQLKAEVVCASRVFLEFLSSKMSAILNIPDKPIHVFKSKNRKNPIYSIVFYINDGQKLADLMYGHNPKLYLDRKYNIFESWKFVKRRKHVLRRNCRGGLLIQSGI